MMRRTPLKSKTPLKAKTPLRSRTSLGVSHEEGGGKAVRKRRSEPNYIKDMDTVFQFWVRLRDSMPGGYCRCISCGKIKSFDHIQAGHYMSRRHMSTRWNPMNCNGECDYCNGRDGDHLIGYRRNLVMKIGEAKTEWLEAESRRTAKKLSDFDIKVMIKDYSQKILILSSVKHIHISKTVMDIIKRYDKMKL